MEYTVNTTGNETLIEHTDSEVKVRVSNAEESEYLSGFAYGLGTFYIIKGGFVPKQIFVFQVVNTDFIPLIDADLEMLKKTMDFFFRTLLGTELYIKEVPQDSSLFPQEAARWFGEGAIAIKAV